MSKPGKWPVFAFGQSALEKVAPDAPWVWVITPTADEVMAGMTKDIQVTDVKIADGKMIVSGLKVNP